jgi:hypothetical protein
MAIDGLGSKRFNEGPSAKARDDIVILIDRYQSAASLCLRRPPNPFPNPVIDFALERLITAIKTLQRLLILWPNEASAEIYRRPYSSNGSESAGNGFR